jgi:hypothetical protein
MSARPLATPLPPGLALLLLRLAFARVLRRAIPLAHPLAVRPTAPAAADALASAKKLLRVRSLATHN